MNWSSQRLLESLLERDVERYGIPTFCINKIPHEKIVFVSIAFFYLFYFNERFAGD